MRGPDLTDYQRLVLRRGPASGCRYCRRETWDRETRLCDSCRTAVYSRYSTVTPADPKAA